MKNTLLVPHGLSWETFHPSDTFLRKSGLMLAMYAVLTIATFAVARIVTMDWLPRCTNTQVLIEYPVYNARGVEIDQHYACGAAKRGCNLKSNTSKGPLYECPGLMRPK